MKRSALALALCITLSGCVDSQGPDDSDEPEDGAGETDDGAGADDGGEEDDGSDDGGGADPAIADAIVYRDDLAAHPGCTTEELAYEHGGTASYTCASKAYPVEEEDADKPIVLLVHGNSDTPDSWQTFPADSGMPMIAETLTGLGYRTYAVDLRIDKVDDPTSNNDTENAARNVDHGWATPLVQHFIASAMADEPDRRFSIVGFSLGATVVRDALRRLHIESLEGGPNPWERLSDVILLAGAHHGVSTYAALCGSNPTMRGQIACEMGARDNFSATDFMAALNGPDGAYETPCADGDSAYGTAGACGGNTVAYTTAVMRDISDGSYQDEFVSESSSALAGADNRLLELTDFDESGYFFEGLLKNHYGSCRSQAAIDVLVEALEAP
jgi:Alpha/beta hydrolase family